ncbi:HAD family hydrolase [Polyangium mundeleinium]|uniref:Haloacid dehalogenase-like hydrolase n=1 Tax=Polyangium mundeleinium TaxID=2995306 RepID=A0ABT5F8B4_9BACT|nr:HAD family hydrolase [Polyangium mundeleinium]MDC0749737.1 haloacid dehalogenase-like hydrolase [Polyangium mundeleinium]
MGALFTHRRLGEVERKRLLREVLERARDRSRGTGVVVFDLDGTIMDNRPRVVAILHELADLWRTRHPSESAALAAAGIDDVVYGLVDTLRRLGVSEPTLHEEGFRFWRERFFYDPHIRHDTEIAGARDYVRACYDAGAVIVYLTGRDLPNMALGSFASLRDLGFPIGVVGTELVTKPAFETPDSVFKREVAPALSRLGEVIAVFDNEPANCNLFLEIHPACTTVFVDTQYAPDPPPLDARAHVIHSFELEP